MNTAWRIVSAIAGTIVVLFVGLFMVWAVDSMLDLGIFDDNNGNAAANNGTTIGGGNPDINNTVSGNDCKGDKVGTWSEVNAAGPQRIEVGGGGIQHADLYPAKGIKAISFIVPPREPMIYMGFGSIWEWQCTGTDFVKDATDYARGRLNNGHSGLVYDLRNGKLDLVANVGNMSDAAIQSLLKQHLAAMGENAGRFTTSSSTSVQPNTSTNYVAPNPVVQPQNAGTSSSYSAPPAANSSSTSTCPDGVRGPDFVPDGKTEWNPEPTDSYRVVHYWSNWKDFDQTEKKFLLFPGEVPQFQGGGSFWYYQNTDACKTAAEAAYNDTTLPAGR